MDAGAWLWHWAKCRSMERAAVNNEQVLLKKRDDVLLQEWVIGSKCGWWYAEVTLKASYGAGEQKTAQFITNQDRRVAS